jgi:very-short-patch-repair endonuclease
MLIWIPPYENIKILIECDGYEFHKSKEAFTSDRQRDRALKNKRIEVLRFSGSEIKNNFIEISREVMNLLMEQLTTG